MLSVRGHENIQHSETFVSARLKCVPFHGGRVHLCCRLTEGDACALNRCIKTTPCLSQDRKLCVLLPRLKKKRRMGWGGVSLNGAFVV